MTIKMKPKDYWNIIDKSNEILNNDDDDFLIDIKPSKYELTNPQDIINQQNHLKEEEKHDLINIYYVNTQNYSVED